MADVELTNRAHAMPPALERIAERDIVEIDVREALRKGEEPFHAIMAARNRVPDGGVLRLRAIFEPVPLYRVMANQGFDHWTERLAEDDWRVWFYPAGPAERPAPAAAADPDPETRIDVRGGEADDPADGDVVLLDVRGMEPPEPMVATLEALDTLPEGATLVQINVRVPQFLLPRLDEDGWSYEIHEHEDGPVRVFIRRAGG